MLSAVKGIVTACAVACSVVGAECDDLRNLIRSRVITAASSATGDSASRPLDHPPPVSCSGTYPDVAPDANEASPAATANGV